MKDFGTGGTMKKRIRTVLRVVSLHLIVSGVALGGIRVYQQGYNTMHQEQLQMASLTLQPEHAQLQFLEYSCAVPLAILQEDSLLYYAAYVMTDQFLQSWTYILSFINSS